MSNEKPIIFVLDDSRFYLDEISQEIGDQAVVRTFLGPNDFDENVDPEELAKAQYFLVDYDLGNATAIDLNLAQFIRERGFTGKLVLWSLFTNFTRTEQQEINKHFSKVVPKEFFTWADLATICAQ